MQPQLPKSVPWWAHFIVGTTWTVPAPTREKFLKERVLEKSSLSRPETDLSGNLSRLDCSKGPFVLFAVQESKWWVWARAAWQRKEKNLTENDYCSQKTYVNLNSGCRRQSTNIGSFKNKNPHLRMKIVSLVVYLPPLSSVLKNVWLFASPTPFFIKKLKFVSAL